MDAPSTTLAVQLDAHPGDILPWMRQAARDTAAVVAPDGCLVVGPPTVSFLELAPYETAALYIAPRAMSGRMPLVVSHYPLAMAITQMPLHQTRLSLEIRVWSSPPATLDAVLRHFTGHFAHAHVILSGVAPSLSRGAPKLACHLWLCATLAADGPAFDRATAYAAWREQYRALRGDYPADALRSFRGVLADCKKALRRAEKRMRPG